MANKNKVKVAANCIDLCEADFVAEDLLRKDVLQGEIQGDTQNMDKAKEQAKSTGKGKGKSKTPSRGRGTVKLVSAPEAFNGDEILFLWYCQMLQGMKMNMMRPCENGEQESERQGYLAMFKKLYAAYSRVVEGKVRVLLGKMDDVEVILERNRCNDWNSECELMSSLYGLWLTWRGLRKAHAALSADWAKRQKATEAKLGKARRELAETNGQVERLGRENAELRKALDKAEREAKRQRDPLSRSIGRLPGKRDKRIKAVPVMFKGKRRVSVGASGEMKK